MGIFQTLQDHGHGEVHLCRDGDTQLQAIVAIHDTRLGPALGGSRFIPYATDRAALTDALRLARAMTYKAALAGVPHGGGKAVVMQPQGEFDRVALFARFGRFVDALGGRYITTEDSGTGIDDMEAIRSQTSYVAGVSQAHGGSGDPSPITALGVRRGIEACVQLALGKDSLKGVHVAVQGVGNVGAHLCRELAAAGARLSIADVRDTLVAQLAKELDAQVVPSAEVHRVECDVFAPCALGGAINDRTVPELRCRVVAGAANNQLAADDNGLALHDRGILYAPDYAINAGGLINVAEEVAGYDAQRVRERTMAIYGTITRIAERSAQQDLPPHVVARALVEEILTSSAK